MEETNAIRAITIGVGVLIAIATISLVLMYYNTAKVSVSAIGKGNNLYITYNKHIVDILTRPEARGTDVINLLNYFDKNYSMNLILIREGNIYDSREAYREKIRPNEKFLITQNDESGVSFTIEALD